MIVADFVDSWLVNDRCFGFCFFVVLACQVAITLLKLYTSRRDGVSSAVSF